MIAFFRSMTGRIFAYVTAGTFASFAVSTTVALQGVHHPFVLLVFTLSLLALAFFVARVATRPITDLASAATRLERDIDAPPMPERGPVEVRAAAAAFNAMQGRIQRHLAERTYMLAAITHDLQTPITRLRLRLEKVADEELRGKLIADLTAMGATIREGLDLARSLETREPALRVDLDSLLESICDDAAEMGADVTLTGKTSAYVNGVPNDLRRLIANVLDNAIAYGTYARVACESRDARATVSIRDGGPGIPPEQLEDVFGPFVRLEASRSRETGGTGLGLTIARNIATRLDGSISLRNHPEGGLEVTLELPLG